MKTKCEHCNRYFMKRGLNRHKCKVLQELLEKEKFEKYQKELKEVRYRLSKMKNPTPNDVVNLLDEIITEKREINIYLYKGKILV